MRQRNEAINTVTDRKKPGADRGRIERGEGCKRAGINFGKPEGDSAANVRKL